MKKQLFISIVCLLFACVSAQAQWSNDAVNNLRISKEGDSSQWGAIAHPTNDGKIFVSWAEWRDGMNMYIKLQLLDMDGNALWEEGGIYVAKQPTQMWTGGYDMKVTPDGCAVIAHSDSRHDAEARKAFEPHAYKIDQEGNFLWGLEGVELPSMERYALRPQIGVTNNGEVLIGYSDSYGDDDSYFTITKVNADGTIGWAEPLHLLGGFGCFAPCGESDLFLSIIENGDLVLQCLDIYGENIWGESVVVESRDPNTRSETFPIPDGKGNVVMPYQRYITTGIIYAGMQRVSPEGELLMGLTGIDLSTEDGTHSIPGIALNPEREEIVAYWDMSFAADAHLLVHKFNYNGDPIWPEPKELESEYIWGYASAHGTVLDDGSIIMIYGDYQGAISISLTVRKLDADGNTLWIKHIGAPASIQDPCNILLNDQAILFWADNREYEDSAHGGTIWGQNIYYSDGSMGPSAIEGVKASESGVIRFDGENINTTVTQDGQLYIYNTNGMLVKTVALTAGHNTIAADLAAGLYIVRVEAGNETDILKLII